MYLKTGETVKKAVAAIRAALSQFGKPDAGFSEPAARFTGTCIFSKLGASIPLNVSD